MQFIQPNRMGNGSESVDPRVVQQMRIYEADGVVPTRPTRWGLFDDKNYRADGGGGGSNDNQARAAAEVLMSSDAGLG